MKIYSLILSICFFYFQIDLKATNVSGSITSNTIWTGSILVVSDVQVEEGVLLTIEAGTLIEFNNNTKLTVYGQLKALGNKANKIHFNALVSMQWAGIRIENKGLIADSTVLDFCDITGVKSNSSDNFSGGVPLYILGVSKLRLSNSSIHDNVLHYNDIEKKGADCGGLKIENCSPFIYNNSILSNIHSLNRTLNSNEYDYNQNDGGGIALYKSNARIINNTISKNKSIANGGGLYLVDSNPTLANNIISENTTVFNGAGLYLINSSPVLINNVVDYNTSSDLNSSYAGGISFRNSSNAIIINCTIVHNTSQFGAGLYITNSNPKIYNSIIFFNYTSTSVNVGINLTGSSLPEFYDSNIEAGSEQLRGLTGKYNYSSSYNMEMDPKFTSSNLYTFNSISPCINTGLQRVFNDSIQKYLGYDVRGKLRVFGNTIDMGAYEYQSLNNVVSGRLIGQVRWSGIVNFNGNIIIDAGSSLMLKSGTVLDMKSKFGITAFGSLKALGSSLDTVVFKQGFTKIVSLPGADSSIFNFCTFKDISNNNPILVRNFSNVRITNSLFINNKADVGSCIALENANIQILNNEFSNCIGSAIYVSKSNPLIENNYIHDNKSGGFKMSGTAIYLSKSNAIIHKNKIERNQNTFINADASGIYATNSAPSIIENTLTHNFTNGKAGAIYIATDTLKSVRFTLAYNVIANNKSDRSGGGVYILNSTGDIKNNIFSNNSSMSSGAGVDADTCNLLVSNNLFVNNSTLQGNGAGMKVDNCTCKFYNNTFANNESQGYAGLYIVPKLGQLTNIDLVNSIFYGNTNPNSDDGVNLIDLQPIRSIYNNFKNDPSFVRPSLGVGVNFDGLSADWSLMDQSICKNKGLITCDIDTTIYNFDVLKNKRIVNNIDFGAIETKEAEIEKYFFKVTITKPTTWNSLNYKTTHLVCGNLTILDKATLTIEPGVSIQFHDTSGMKIFGSLIANGTKEDSIIFTKNSLQELNNSNGQRTGWRGIVFEPKNDNDSSKISFCKFKHVLTFGNFGIPVFDISNFSKLTINHSTFESNWCHELLRVQNASPDISFNTFKNNYCSFTPIECSQQGNFRFWNNTVTNNKSDNCGALSLSYSSPSIVGNIFSNNEALSNLVDLYHSNPDVFNNLMVNNKITSSNKINASLVTMYFSNSIFENNIIYNNDLKAGYIFQLKGARPDFLHNNLQLVANLFNTKDGILKYENNFHHDPMFVKPSTTIGLSTESADWTLHASSQNINAGSPNVKISRNEKDNNGHARFFNDTHIDIGAFEHPFDVSPIDSLTLLALYNSTKPEGWREKWDLSLPVSKWFGVRIEKGRVQGLLMHGNNLDGTIPATIKNLIFVAQIQLYDNRFDQISKEIGALQNLQILNLKNCSITGTIPIELSNASNLNVINLSENKLSGDVPVEFGELSNLALLELNTNQLENLPNFSQSVFKTNLQLLALGHNRFEFDDLEPNMSVFPGFTYANQDSVDLVTTKTVNAGVNLDLIANIGGIHNYYTWIFKNDTVQKGNSNKLILNNVQVKDDGEYFCVITNDKVPNLKYTRRSITVYVKKDFMSPKIFPIVPYCIGDSVISIVSDNPLDKSVFWYDQSKTKQLANDYKLRYVIPKNKDTDLVYVRRLEGSLASDFVPVNLLLRPSLEFTGQIISATLVPDATYIWYKNGIVIEGDLNQIQSKGNGEYRVKLISSNKQCSSLSRLFTLNGSVFTGLDEQVQANLALNIYPNPAKDILYFQLFNIVGTNFRLKIYDLTGRELIQQTENTNQSEIMFVSIQDLKSGMYLFEITSGQQKIRKPFIKR